MWSLKEKEKNKVINLWRDNNVIFMVEISFFETKKNFE